MKKALSLFLAILFVVGVFPITAISVGAGSDPVPTATIRRYADGTTTALRASELLYVDTTGFSEDAILTYTYTLTGGLDDNANTYSGKASEGGSRIYCSPSFNQNFDKELYIQIAQGSLYKADSNLFTSPKTTDCSFFGVRDDARYTGTAGSVNHGLRVSVVVEDINSASDTFGKTASCYYEDFANADLDADMQASKLLMFVDETVKVAQLFGLCGLLHINCGGPKGKVTSVGDSSILKITKTSETNDSIKALKVGSTNMVAEVNKGNCTHHNNQTNSTDNLVYVINKPVYSVNPKTGVVTISNLTEGVTYYVGGKPVGPATKDDTTLTIGGFKPSSTQPTYVIYQPSGETYRRDTDDVEIPAITYYAVTANAVGQGTVTPSVTQAPETGAVTFTATPNAGYQVSSVSVKYTSSSTAVSYTGPAGGVYSFTMPAADVTVTANFAPIPVDSVTVSPSTKTIYVGDTFDLSATVLPADADDTVTWSSDTTGVATVDTAGKITGVAEGSAVITAAGGNSKSGTCTVTVVKREITVSGIKAANKTYDGTNAATLLFTDVVLSGLLPADAGKLAATATGTFGDAAVGTAKTVTLSGLTLTGELTNKYKLAATGQQTSTAANITAKPHKGTDPDPTKGEFTATVNGIENKTYNGTALTQTFTVYDGTTLIPSSDYTYTYEDNTNAGTAKLIITFKNNYSGTIEETFTIAKAKITISGITANDKNYDGNTSATLDYSGVTFGGIASADTGKLTVTATGTFVDANAGSSKTVNLTNLILSGAAIGNYEFDSSDKQQKNATASIRGRTHKDEDPTPANNEFTAVIEGVADKTYNASAHLQTITVKDGVTTIDPANYTVTYDNNVAAGTNTAKVIVTFKNNYSGTVSKTFSIAKAAITISGIDADDKYYDGNTTATLDFTGVTYGGIIASDSGKLTVTANGAFVDAAVGTDKTVNLTDLALDGEKAANYQLAASGQQTTATASINVKPHKDNDPDPTKGEFTATVNGIENKTYNATAQTQTFTVYDGATLIPSTDYTYTYEKNTDAGTAKLIITFKNNYSGTVEKTFTIAKAKITISGITANDKVYDGNTTAALVYTGVTFGGILAADNGKLTVTATGAFVDANAATGKTVNLSNLQLGGDAVGNYELATIGQQTATTASITAKPHKDNNPDPTKGEFTATLDAIADKLYTGSAITPTGEIVVKDGTATIDSSNYDVAFTNNVNVGTATVTVTFKQNYSGTLVGSFKIVPRIHKDNDPDPTKGEFTATVNGIENKTYNATAQTQTFTVYDGATLIPSTDYTYTYEKNTDAGTAKLIITFKNNYSGTVEKTFTIAKAKITISGIAANDKVYDGNTTATLVYTGVTFGGILAADNGKLTVTATGAFVDANAATGKTVNLSNLQLGGDAVGNYELATIGQQTATTASITAKPHKDNNPDPTKGEFSATISGVVDKTYDSLPKYQTVTVYDGTTEIPATNYDVSYDANTEAGTNTAKVIVTFKNNYSGVVSKTFTIKKCNITAQWTKILETYDGTEKTPTYNLLYAKGEDVLSLTFSATCIDAGYYPLTATLAGTAAANYNLTNPAVNFTIEKAEVDFTVSNNVFVYDGNPHFATIDNDKGLVKDVDYSVTYYKNGTPVANPTASNLYLIVITMINTNYVVKGGDTVGSLSISDSTPTLYKTKFVNGGGVGDDVALTDAVKGAPRVTIKNPFTNAGYVFIGWACDGNVYRENEAFEQADKELVFTALWAEKRAVDGDVSSAGSPVADAVVILMKGNTVVATATSKANGTFAFPDADIVDGSYLVIASHNGIKETVSFTVSETNTHISIILPLGRTNTAVEIGPDTPPINVENLDNNFEDNSPNYTPEDKQIVDDGGLVEFKLTVNKIELPETDANRIEIEKLSKNIILYLDMTLDKITTDKFGTSTTTNLSKSNGLIKVEIPIPVEHRNEDGYVVYRKHGTVCHTLTTTPNADGEYIAIDSAKTTITIYVKNFSIYAIGYIVYNTEPIWRFVDVPEEEFFYDPVYWAVEMGITTGKDWNHFFPFDVTTRGEMVTFLWRLNGSPKLSPEECEANNPFTDVKPDSYYYYAVTWGVKNHVVRGVTHTEFAADLTVTRGQAMAFVARYAGVMDEDTGYTCPFVDVDPNEYYWNAITWAYNTGVTTGVSGTSFDPDGDCLRGEAVTFLYRYFFYAKKQS